MPRIARIRRYLTKLFANLNAHVTRFFTSGRNSQNTVAMRQRHREDIASEVVQKRWDVRTEDEMISISVEFYRRLESGRIPNARTLERIAASLDVSTEVLLGVPPKKPDKE